MVVRCNTIGLIVYSHFGQGYVQSYLDGYINFLFMLVRKQQSLGRLNDVNFCDCVHPLQMVFYYLVAFINILYEIRYIFHRFRFIWTIDMDTNEISTRNAKAK